MQLFVEITIPLFSRNGVLLVLTELTVLKAQYNLLSDAILRLRNNTMKMYFDRYLSCFGIKMQIILANLYKLKIEY